MNPGTSRIDHHQAAKDKLCAPRMFRFGHVRQLDAVGARFLSDLARLSPLIATGEALTYVDIDDTIRSTFGYAKTEHHKT